MLERKRKLANALWGKDITVIYIEDEMNRVFVVTETEDVNEVVQLVRAEGFELVALPEKGTYATKTWLKNGYWCDLR